MIAGRDFGAGAATAIEITAFAQCALLLGAMLARIDRRLARVIRLHLHLSASRLDRATLVALAIGLLGLLLTVASGEANINQFLVFTSPSGYGSFGSAAGATSGYFTALQLVAGLAVVLIVLRFTSSSARQPVSCLSYFL